MRFLIDADLPRSTAGTIRRRGHEAVDARDIGLGAAKDPQIAEYARLNRLCLITGDFDFADIRNYPPARYYGLVVLELPRNTTSRFIVDLIQRLLEKTEIVEGLPGRLAIVSPGRIRLR
jgi:predicted nuclease of predicted toxin-antitoxin system